MTTTQRLPGDFDFNPMRDMTADDRRANIEHRWGPPYAVEFVFFEDEDEDDAIEFARLDGDEALQYAVEQGVGVSGTTEDGVDMTYVQGPPIGSGANMAWPIPRPFHFDPSSGLRVNVWVPRSEERDEIIEMIGRGEIPRLPNR